MSDAVSADGGGVIADAPAPAAPAESAPMPEVTIAAEPAQTTTPEIEMREAETPPVSPPPVPSTSLPTSEPVPSPTAPIPPTPPTETSIKTRLSQAFEALRFRKRARLDKILALAAKKGKIKNDDVEKLLRVSDATASRYLAQLVQEGKLKRSGSTKETIYETV